MTSGKIRGKKIEILSYESAGSGAFLLRVDGQEIQGTFTHRGCERVLKIAGTTRKFFISQSQLTEDKTKPLYRVLDSQTSQVWEGLRLLGQVEELLSQNAKGIKKGQKIKSQMPGKVVKVNCANGAEIKSGESVLVLEAMKMENEIRASMDGVIANLNVKPGDLIETGTPLFTIEKQEKNS